MIEGGPLSAETSLSALGPGGLSSALWLKLRRQQDLLSQRPTADAVDFQPWEPEPLMSGQDAFQGGAVGRGSVRREDELDRELEGLHILFEIGDDLATPGVTVGIAREGKTGQAVIAPWREEDERVPASLPGGADCSAFVNRATARSQFPFRASPCPCR